MEQLHSYSAERLCSLFQGQQDNMSQYQPTGQVDLCSDSLQWDVFCLFRENKMMGGDGDAAASLSLSGANALPKGCAPAPSSALQTPSVSTNWE